LSTTTDADAANIIADELLRQEDEEEEFSCRFGTQVLAGCCYTKKNARQSAAIPEDLDFRLTLKDPGSRWALIWVRPGDLEVLRAAEAQEASKEAVELTTALGLHPLLILALVLSVALALVGATILILV